MLILESQRNCFQGAHDFQTRGVSLEQGVMVQGAAKLGSARLSTRFRQTGRVEL